VGTVTYKVTSAYALDPKLTGDSALVGIVLTTKGFYVPGPELPFVIGLVVLGALVIRRRV
jgi:hydrogenase/urease accessory protein HupE